MNKMKAEDLMNSRYPVFASSFEIGELLVLKDGKKGKFVLGHPNKLDRFPLVLNIPIMYLGSKFDKFASIVCHHFLHEGSVWSVYTKTSDLSDWLKHFEK